MNKACVIPYMQISCCCYCYLYKKNIYKKNRVNIENNAAAIMVHFQTDESNNLHKT